jgi:hypothetical protein
VGRETREGREWKERRAREGRAGPQIESTAAASKADLRVT